MILTDLVLWMVLCTLWGLSAYRQTCPVGGQNGCSKLTQMHILQWQQPRLMAPRHLIIVADGEVGSTSAS